MLIILIHNAFNGDLFCVLEQVVAFVSQLSLELIALSDHVELALSVSAIRSMTKVAGAHHRHDWAIILSFLVDPGSLGMESPVAARVLVDRELAALLKQLGRVEPVQARNVLFEESAIVEAVGLRRGDHQIAASSLWQLCDLIDVRFLQVQVPSGHLQRAQSILFIAKVL